MSTKPILLPRIPKKPDKPLGMSHHVHSLQIYYEDTDHSGVVYHANYLKYFERAREHMLGVEALKRLLDTQGIGFVVYQAGLKYVRGAEFGDTVEIRSQIRKESPYRLTFLQDAHLASGELLVKGELQLACVGPQKRLVALPPVIVDALGKKPYFLL